MNVIQISMLENTLREHLDEHCARRLMVVDPLRVVIDNWDGEREVECPNHPRFPERGSRTVKLTKELFIDRSDFREEDNNTRFYGVAPGPRAVGLKYSGNIFCKGFERDDRGEISVVHVDIDFERNQKPKTNISWVSAAYGSPAELRLYSYLLKDDRAAIDPEFLKYIDENSEKVYHGVVEQGMRESLNRFDSVQAERFGYFVVDPDTTADRFVMNRIISLKEDKEKTTL
jgi:glutaminyl-tRNA synthetase